MIITKEILPGLIRDFFKKIPDSGITNIPTAIKRSVVVDNKYSLVSESEVLGIIKSNPLLVPNLQKDNNNELIDCDDYALQLKAITTSLYRQRMLSGETTLFPPAVGIVISQSHALNLIITESEGGSPEISLIDPSALSPNLVSDPGQCAIALKSLPIAIIYI